MTNSTLKLVQPTFYVSPMIRVGIVKQRKENPTSTFIIKNDCQKVSVGTMSTAEKLAELTHFLHKNPDEAKHYVFLQPGEQLDIPKLVPRLGASAKEFRVKYALFVLTEGIDADPEKELPISVYYDTLDAILARNMNTDNPVHCATHSIVGELINDHLIEGYAYEDYEMTVTLSMQRRPSKLSQDTLMREFEDVLKCQIRSDKVKVHSLRKV